MKKSQYIAAISVIAAAMGGYSSDAKAQTPNSTEEQLAPLVFILLDTSGSMNELVDEDTNQTRLTKAIAELAGGVKLTSGQALTRPTCSTNCSDTDNECKNCPTANQFKLPFPVWKCDSADDCRYTYELKTISGNAQIAKPDGATNDVTGTNENYRNALAAKYTEDGIIQTYQDAVKFGAAGLAVGSAGSSATKDATIVQQAAEAKEGRVNAPLRSTIIWNDVDNVSSSCDLDFHCAVYRKGCLNNTPSSNCKTINGEQYRFYDKIDYNHHKEKDNDPISNTGGYLDVDVIYPNSGGVQMTGFANKLGVENIYWDNLDSFQTDDLIYLYVVPYNAHGTSTSGFRAEIAFKNDNGCSTLYGFDYSATIDGNISNSTNGQQPGYGTVCSTSCTDYSNGFFGIGAYNNCPNCEYNILGLIKNCWYDEERCSVGDYPIARLKYDGDGGFTIDSIGSFDGFNAAGLEMNPHQSNDAGDPENIYGFSKAETTQSSGLSDVSYGRTLNTSEYAYKHPTDCTLDIGIWDSAKDAHAPLFYPTPSKESSDISTSNAMLIDTLRSYQAHSATPIGEALADMYYMLGLDSENYESVDKGLVIRKSLKPDSTATRIVDEAYACREKAVILITDGSPNGSGITEDDNGAGHGHSTHIWYDADWLYSKSHAKSEDVKTYVIAYAFGDNPEENIENQDPADPTTAAYKLNKTAWKGGTCLHPTTHARILPSDSAAYEAMVESAKPASQRKPPKQRQCFYSAADGTALRKAMAEALSATLQGTVSKTAVSTSSALGYVKNIHEGKYQNGYYNLYSGYQITPGLVRRSILQRESTICNSSTGKFEAGQQHMDLSTILSCRLNKNCVGLNESSAFTSEQEREQIAKDIANKKNGAVGSPCALRGTGGVKKVRDNTNTCLSSRYIFAGDYSADRYAVNPDIVSINPNGDPGESNNVPKGIGFVKDAMGAEQDYNFIAGKGRNTAVDNPHINTMYSKSTANYILSPYECGSDLDCVKEGKEGYCDLGRCVTGAEFDGADSCSEAKTDNSVICIAGKIRERNNDADACDYHFSEEANGESAEKKGCDPGYVCHAGKCLPGTVIGGDLKSFMATMPLGTIEYATPVVVEPPTRTVKSASYLRFSQTYWNRDNMLLVAANDGMLHAFILGQNQEHSEGYDVDSAIRGKTPKLSLTEGDELWAFVPKATMPKLSSLPRLGTQTFLNAAPTVVDVPNPNDEWRTVVVGGFGKGARGYYALDITDPLHPSILWEIDNQWQAATASNITTYPDMSNADVEVYGDVAAFKANLDKIIPGDNKVGFPFADMGYSSAKPLITRMLIRGESTSKVETVAILPGGSRNVNRENAGVLYIVRLFPDKDKKDLLVAAIYTKHDITSAPAVYPNNFNSIAQRLYFGDKGGNFYALDVSNFNPSEWAQNKFPTNVNTWSDTVTIGGEEKTINYLKPSFGADCGHLPNIYSSITYKPAVSLYSSGNYPTIQVVFGTGDNSDLTTTSEDHNYVAKFYDVHNGTNGYQLNPKSFSTNTNDKPQLYVFNLPEDNGVVEKGENTFNTDLCTTNGMKFDIVTGPPRAKDAIEDPKPFPPAQKMSGPALTYNYDTYFPTYISNTDDQSKGPYGRLCKVGNAAIFKMPSQKKHNVIDSTKVQNNQNNATIAGNLAANGYITLNPGTKIYGLEVSSQQMCIGTSHTEIAAPRLIAQTGVDAAGLIASDKHNELNDSATDIANFALNLDAIAPTVTPVSWASVYE